MKIAVIGVGNVGSVLADKLSGAGHDVAVAASSAGSAEQAAEGMDCSPAASPAEAARDADVVVLAVPADAMGEISAEIEAHVDGKPVIDVSNGPKSVGDGGSLAEELQQRLPNARVVKAFNTAFASRMADPVENSQPLDGFLAGDDAQAKATVAELVRDVGFEPLDTGDLKMARALEGMAWMNISLNMANSWPWQSAWRLERN
jgi:hypothetical protein